MPISFPYLSIRQCIPLSNPSLSSPAHLPYLTQADTVVEKWDIAKHGHKDETQGKTLVLSHLPGPTSAAGELGRRHAERSVGLLAPLGSGWVVSCGHRVGWKSYGGCGVLGCGVVMWSGLDSWEDGVDWLKC